jgi:SAM-dependent methyltransferase
MATNEDYAAMQKRYYSSVPAEDEAMKQNVVGCYDAHEKYPYEDFLLSQFPAFYSTEGMLALDFGCGPGRMIRRLAPYFEQVDGVDISRTCLETARRWTGDLRKQPVLFENDGVTLSLVPSERYDFVYSTIAFHHIASYENRLSLLREMFRVLKPGGRIAIQMFYSSMDRSEWPAHVQWRESNHDAERTNGYHDVRVNAEGLKQIEADLHEIGYDDFDFRMAPYPEAPHPKPHGDTDWVFIYAEKPL